MNEILLPAAGILIFILMVAVFYFASKKLSSVDLKTLKKNPEYEYVKHEYKETPISPDIFAWSYMFLLIVLFFIFSVVLSVISWIYYGVLAGLGTLAACLFISFFGVIVIAESSKYKKIVHWKFDRECLRSRR